jgi:trehalose 6-phosphate phosphatase
MVMTLNHSSELFSERERVWDLARGRVVALFLDVDGTLLDFAERPELVAVPSGLVQSLARIERRLEGALALVSGRSIEELDELFTPLNLRASGVHGAQMRFDPREPFRGAPSVRELPDRLWKELLHLLVEFPGTFAENKGFSFAVHYRRAPDVAPGLRDALERLIASRSWGGVEILDAHYAFELKSPNFDKGRAIALFMNGEPFRGRTPVFIGDDTTDEAGFAAVAERGGIGFSVGVRRRGVSGVFVGPADVRDWLAGFAARGDRE